MDIDNKSATPYNDYCLGALIQDAVRSAVQQALRQPEQLDNEIYGDDMHSHKENDMKDYYPTIGGKSVHIRASSQADLARKIALREASAAKGESLSAYADRWLRNKINKPANKRIRETTIAEYGRQIQYMKRFFADTPLSGITTPLVQSFADWMADGKKNGFRNDLTEQTIGRVLATLRQIVNDSIEYDEIIPRMPYKPRLIVNNGAASKHHKALDTNLFRDVKQKIPSVADKRARMWLALLVTTGMRPEEIYGLKWEDFSSDWKYIRVVRTVTYPTKSKPVIGLPKTAHSNRYINVLDWVADILKPNKADGFVFGGEAPLCYASRTRLQNLAWKSVGLKGTGVCPYDFRANFATMLCESGQTDKQVADMMGHADTRMVDTVYAPARKEGILLHKSACEGLFGQ